LKPIWACQSEKLEKVVIPLLKDHPQTEQQKQPVSDIRLNYVAG